MTATLRVALDMTFPDRNQGGVGRYARRLLGELGARDDVVPVRIGERPGCGMPATLRWLAVGAGDALAAGGAALLHCPAFVAPWRISTPAAITVHDNSVRRYPGGHPLEWRAYCAAVLPGRARRASVVITPSEFVREELLDAWALDESRVVAVPLGVSTEFAPGGRPARSGRPRLLFAGAPIERKNLPSLLRAMAAARPGSALADAELVLSGASRERFPDMVRAAADVGVGERLRWPGQVPDGAMPDLYRSVDALVYPSLDEGFGLPPLEAMACGTPVVAAARGSLPETLGDAALLVDPTRTDELGDAIEHVLCDTTLRGRLTEAGIGRSARYTWERCTAETCQAYRRALA